MVPCPVSRITDTVGSSSRSRRSTCMPSSSPRRRSRTTASTVCVLRAASASSPLAASSGRYPMSRAHSPRLKRSERSSSTISTAGALCVWVSSSPFTLAFLHGEVEQHGRPALLAAGDLDRASVLLHDALRNREPEAGAPGLGREERVEHLGQDPARNPDPGVDDPHLLVLDPRRTPRAWCGRRAPRIGSATPRAARRTAPPHP